ncbi:F-box domain containing protein [Tanacetum coccineum]
MNVESDRLSSLPDDLIHKILSFIDTLDAIKTSCLSSRWRFIWTTMPCLNFPNDDFFTLLKLSKFFSGRDNQREVSSVNLSFRGKSTKGFVGKILEYASSHNVRQLNLTCLIESAIIKFPLSLISSETRKHLTLTTLYLDGIILSRYNTDSFSGLISKCVNLKNLTLRYCRMRGSNFDICHSQLSNLTMVFVPPNVGIFSVVAPQLKNLRIRHLQREFLISAPDLAYLLLDGHDHVNFSGDDFNSLEKVDICIDHPSKTESHKLVGLLQRLRSVKSLTLNLEILEILSASAELMSHQPSPFAILESLKIYPKRFGIGLKEKVDISAEVKNYLLDGSRSATFTIISREIKLEKKRKERKGNKNIFVFLSFILIRKEKKGKEKEGKFEGCRKGNVITWAKLIDGYAKLGRIEVARRLFDEMPERDVIFVVMVMMAGYVERHCLEALERDGSHPQVAEIYSVLEIGSPLDSRVNSLRLIRISVLYDLIDILVMSRIVSSFHLKNTICRYARLKQFNKLEVKDVRSMLDEAFLSKMEVPTRWIKSIPIKVNVFAWKLYLDRLPTRSNLSRRNVSLPSLACPLCDHVLEDSSHLFFGCSVAKDIQKLICRWWNLDVHPYESYEFGHLVQIYRLVLRRKEMLDGVFYVSVVGEKSLWKLQKPILFASPISPKDVIFDNIVLRSFMVLS